MIRTHCRVCHARLAVPPSVPFKLRLCDGCRELLRGYVGSDREAAADQLSGASDAPVWTGDGYRVPCVRCRKLLTFPFQPRTPKVCDACFAGRGVPHVLPEGARRRGGLPLEDGSPGQQDALGDWEDGHE